VQPLYGRDELLARARACLDGARGGQGQLLLLAGEPGIGKSALAERVAAEAVAGGALAASGRCWEAGGAPAYWPWIQVFRALGLDEDPFGGEPLAATASAELRFAAFDRAVRALQARAAQTPLVLVLDDLHAADAPSLLLLLLLARQLRSSRLLVVGAYREHEPRDAELAMLLAKLGREAEVIHLGRLSEPDVALWLEATRATAPPQAAAELFRVSEGHPLFVVEALRLGGVPSPARARASLSALLDEHLGRLSPSARLVLEAASVLGREVSLREVAATAGVDLDAAHLAANEAVGVSLLQMEGAELYRFSHMLLCDRLHAELAPSRRRVLHAQAGEVLLARHPPALAGAVFHFFEAGDAVAAERRATLALAAAQAALARLAFEEAAQTAEQALALAPTERLAMGLAVALGEALIRLGREEAGRARCAEAAERAERLIAEDPAAVELLARAALAYATELSSGVIDEPMNALLRRALAALLALEHGYPELLARVQARLAAGLTPPASAESAAEVVTLMQAAIASARVAGDRQTLSYVLQFGATVSLLVPEAQRFAMLEQAVALAKALEQPLVLLQTLPAYVTALVADGRGDEAQSACAQLEALVTESRHPIHRVRLGLLRALLALVNGDAEAAERHNQDARALAERSGSERGQRMWLVQRLSFALLRGAPELVAAEGESLIAHFEWMRNGAPYVGWIYAGMGRRDRALERFQGLDLSAAALASLEPMGLVGAGETCAALNDAEAAARLYPALLAVAGRTCSPLAPGAIMGPAPRTLGRLALLLGQADVARRHFGEAAEFWRKLGANALADACLALGEPPATAGAAAARQAPVPVEAAAPAPPTPRAPAPELRREGELWTLALPGVQPLRLRHSKGLAYLAQLMARPHQPMHVLELAGIEHAPGDAGPLLDERAKRQYAERIDALREQLEEAERFADAARATRARAELDAIAEQLASAVGLGGRDRVAASVSERARINVQRCLKEALLRIGQANPALGRRLTAAVKSGTYCVYAPL
jgi:tetratricopeptide (TPR) repeat protein